MRVKFEAVRLVKLRKVVRLVMVLDYCGLRQVAPHFIFRHLTLDYWITVKFDKIDKTHRLVMVLDYWITAEFDKTHWFAFRCLCRVD